jgi:hypothetical protein
MVVETTTEAGNEDEDERAHVTHARQSSGRTQQTDGGAAHSWHLAAVEPHATARCEMVGE